MQKSSRLCVPNLTSPIIAASDKSNSKKPYLSPFLLKQQLVSGNTCAFNVLDSWKFWFFFSYNFIINSKCLNIYFRSVFLAVVFYFK